MSIDEWAQDIHQGDAVETLAKMPESSVHCVVTSPPYYSQRDYQADGQLGLEETLDEYIEKLVEVGDEIRRVLRPDGNLWLNLGDKFAGSGGAGGQWGRNDTGTAQRNGDPGSAYNGPAGGARFRRKSKMLVPHRVVIALQDAGWVVRADAVWSKPDPTPGPWDDRLNETKEFLFHLTPEPMYWWDLHAIREPHKEHSIERSAREDNRHEHSKRQTLHNEETLNPDQFCHPDGKNPGDVFRVPTSSYSAEHFAVYPEDLIQPLIKSSCPERSCGGCGAPYERQIDETPLWELDVDEVDRPQKKVALERYRNSELTVEHLEAVRSMGFGDGQHGEASQGTSNRIPPKTLQLAFEAKDVLEGYFREFVPAAERHVGDWEQACDCETDETEPGIVVDPFAGAGTTAVVAKRLGRRFVGIDINSEFVALAQKRVGITVDEPGLLLEDEETPITAYANGGGPSMRDEPGGDSR